MGDIQITMAAIQTMEDIPTTMVVIPTTTVDTQQDQHIGQTIMADIQIIMEAIQVTEMEDIQTIMVGIQVMFNSGYPSNGNGGYPNNGYPGNSFGSPRSDKVKDESI